MWLSCLGTYLIKCLAILASMPNTSDTAHSDDAFLQRCLAEDIVLDTRADSSGKETACSPNGSNESDQNPRNGGRNASRPTDSLVIDTKDIGNDPQGPWKDLEDYMIRGKPPEYNAEGLVTLWNLRYDTGPRPSNYMATDFE